MKGWKKSVIAPKSKDLTNEVPNSFIPLPLRWGRAWVGVTLRHAQGEFMVSLSNRSPSSLSPPDRECVVMSLRGSETTEAIS